MVGECLNPLTLRIAGLVGVMATRRILCIFLFPIGNGDCVMRTAFVTILFVYATYILKDPASMLALNAAVWMPKSTDNSPLEWNARYIHERLRHLWKHQSNGEQVTTETSDRYYLSIWYLRTQVEKHDKTLPHEACRDGFFLKDNTLWSLIISVHTSFGNAVRHSKTMHTHKWIINITWFACDFFRTDFFTR